METGTKYALILFVATAVLVWRVVVFTQGPTGLLLPFGIMGLVFWGCGLRVFLAKREHHLFFLYCIFTALHWGGIIQGPNDRWENVYLLIYLVLGAMLAESLFLHFILKYPRPWPIAAKKMTLAVLYGPVLLAGCLAVAVLAAPATMTRSLLNVFWIFKVAQSDLFALASIVVIVTRYTRVRKNGPEWIMFLWTVVGVAPYLTALLVENLFAGVSLPAGMGSEETPLFFVVMPLAYAYAILRDPHERELGSDRSKNPGPGVVSA